MLAVTTELTIPTKWLKPIIIIIIIILIILIITTHFYSTVRS